MDKMFNNDLHSIWNRFFFFPNNYNEKHNLSKGWKKMVIQEAKTNKIVGTENPLFALR